MASNANEHLLPDDASKPRTRARTWRARASRLWRQARTGFAFVFFGVVALSLGFTAFPLCRLLPGTPAERDARAQRLIHWTYGFFVRSLSALGLTRMRFEGFERLRTSGPHLVVANHPTLIDFGIVISQLPQADCIVNEAWAKSFFVGRIARAAGYVVNTSGPQAVADSAARLAAGRTVLWFPEGSRSPRGGLRPFQRGAAHVALRSGCDLEPVTIRCEPLTLVKGEPWWDVPGQRAEYRIRVEEPVRLASVGREALSDGLAARRLTAALEDRVREGLRRD